MFGTASRGVAVDGDSTRCADLPAVGVTAELQLIPQGGGVAVILRGVGEEDRDLIPGNGLPGPLKIIGAKKVGIIDSADPDPLILTLDRTGLIEQEGEPRLLERRDHLQKIMIPENRESAFMEMGNECHHLS
jgi:hypothetical protein